MALKLIAVSGYTSIVQVIIGVTPQGVVVDLGVPSVKVSAGAGALKSGYQIQVSGITDPGAGATIPDPGPYVVSYTATSTKVLADGTLVLRQDDETGVINAIPQIPGSPPIPFPVSFKYKITVAGQLKVSAQ